MFNDSQLFDGKMYAHVNHVIPNLMSISLPPGRYLLIFTYRFPGLFKILTLFCALGYIRLLFKCLSEHTVEKSSSKVLSEYESVEKPIEKSVEKPIEKPIEKPAIILPEVTSKKIEDYEEPREAVLRKVRTEEETLPNFRLRKAASQATNMRDWQVLVRATLQRRRIVNELEQVFATKDKSRNSEGRRNPADSEPKGGKNEVEKQTDSHTKPVTSKPAASMPSRPHNDQTTGAQIGNSGSRTRHYSSTSSISEASVSDEDRSSERSDNRTKGPVKKVPSTDRNITNERLHIEGFIGRVGSNDRDSLSQENKNYLLDVNANFTSKRAANGSSNRAREAIGSNASPVHDPRSSDSSGGEETHIHGRNQRSGFPKDGNEEGRKLGQFATLFRK